VRVFPKGLKKLPKWHGRYEIEWHRGHLRWNGREWVVAGGLVWASSFQPVLFPAEPSEKQLEEKRRAQEQSKWVWEMLQFDSLRSEAEIYEAEWDYLPTQQADAQAEPGEETEFELVDDDEVLSDGALPRAGRWWIPGWVHQVEREVFGRALS
jgi:hypothetical protein